MPQQESATTQALATCASAFAILQPRGPRKRMVSFVDVRLVRRLMQ